MKQLLTFIFIGFTGVAFAQSPKVLSAYNYLKEGKLDKAKKYIDAAAKHPKTSIKSKTWRYRGDIYYSISVSQDPAYKKLHTNPAQVAFESYVTAKKLNNERSKGAYDKQIKRNLTLLQNMSLNRGVGFFNDKRYDQAIDRFKTSNAIAEHFGYSDSLALYNLALAYERSKKNDQAIEYYKKCIQLNYKGASCCNAVIYVLSKENKDAEIQRLIKEYRTKYPNDINLITTQINIALKNGNFKNAKNNLGLVIKNDPTNHVLHFSLGTVLDNIKDLAGAEKSYKKAIQLKPDYFDANYNLGALYFNQGVEINNSINNEQDMKKYEVMKKNADNTFKKAVPYLEKAHELKPKDKNTLLSLKAIYARLGNNDKYNEVRDLLNN